MSSTPWAGRRLHFIGVGGAGMSGLALVAKELGAQVSGSDRAESSYLVRLREAGIEPAVGHDAGNVPADAEVVVSTAIPEDNPELTAAREAGALVLHRGDLKRTSFEPDGGVSARPVSSPPSVPSSEPQAARSTAARTAERPSFTSRDDS